MRSGAPLIRHTILKTTPVELGRTVALEECALWMPTHTGLERQLFYTLRHQNPVEFTVPIQLPVINQGQLINSGITNPDILKSVISLIFDKAVLKPTLRPIYARLCSDLNEKLPPSPSDEPDGKEITFKRIHLNNCQETFEGTNNLRSEMIAPDQEMEG
ncbi:hypothetical protein F0562_028880 [Nyssa sinensis]|uniref:MIF4G domain-containing protein n=1 Tax=Nyssa sinensis TaxID=561372 RepID=A0A5J5B3F6_9ASTE|nr:hypothetical protein F0562_028880 [Nyssa sinensis]